MDTQSHECIHHTHTTNTEYCWKLEGNHIHKLEGAGTWVVDVGDIFITKFSGELSHCPERMTCILLSLCTFLIFFFSQMKFYQQLLVEAA